MHASPGQWPWTARAWSTSVQGALLVLVGPALVLAGTAGASSSGAAAVALGSVGSAALVAAVCAAAGALVVHVLAVGVPCRCAPRRERTAGGVAVLRAEQPGRPGRPQPRAPGAALLPRPDR